MRPFSWPSLIACLPLVAALGLAGCDKAKPDAGQANVAEVVPSEPTPQGSVWTRDHKGLPLPALPFEAPDGGPQTFGKWRGHPVLVNLWATWCAPCVKELPTLDTLAAGSALPIIAISEDNGVDPQVQRFWQDKGMATLKPYTDSHMRLMTALQVDTLPTTILFSSSGEEIWRVTGGLDWTGPRAASMLAEAK